MTISTAYKTDAFNNEGPMPLALVTINHASFSNPIRVVDNTEDVTFGGETFVAFPFDVTLPDEREDGIPKARLVIDNVTREIAQHIRSIAPDSPLSVQIDVVRMGETVTPEATVPNLRLVNVTVDALTVSGDLELEDLAREPYPGRTFTPAEYPGLLQ